MMNTIRNSNLFSTFNKENNLHEDYRTNNYELDHNKNNKIYSIHSQSYSCLSKKNTRSDSELKYLAKDTAPNTGSPTYINSYLNEIYNTANKNTGIVENGANKISINLTNVSSNSLTCVTSEGTSLKQCGKKEKIFELSYHYKEKCKRSNKTYTKKSVNKILNILKSCNYNIKATNKLFPEYSTKELTYIKDAYSYRSLNKKNFSPEEDKLLLVLSNFHSYDFKNIIKYFNNRTVSELKRRLIKIKNLNKLIPFDNLTNKEFDNDLFEAIHDKNALELELLEKHTSFNQDQNNCNLELVENNNDNKDIVRNKLFNPSSNPKSSQAYFNSIKNKQKAVDVLIKALYSPTLEELENNDLIEDAKYENKRYSICNSNKEANNANKLISSSVLLSVKDKNNKVDKKVNNKRSNQSLIKIKDQYNLQENYNADLFESSNIDDNNNINNINRNIVNNNLLESNINNYLHDKEIDTDSLYLSFKNGYNYNNEDDIFDKNIFESNNNIHNFNNNDCDYEDIMRLYRKDTECQYNKDSVGNNSYYNPYEDDILNDDVIELFDMTVNNKIVDQVKIKNTNNNKSNNIFTNNIVKPEYNKNNEKTQASKINSNKITFEQKQLNLTINKAFSHIFSLSNEYTSEFLKKINNIKSRHVSEKIKNALICIDAQMNNLSCNFVKDEQAILANIDANNILLKSERVQQMINLLKLKVSWINKMSTY